MDHLNAHTYVVEKKQEEIKYSNTWLILASVFMIIPVFNLIFGAIGLKKYPKNVQSCKAKRLVCIVSYIIGIVQIVIIIYTGLVETIKAMIDSLPK